MRLAIKNMQQRFPELQHNNNGQGKRGKAYCGEL